MLNLVKAVFSNKKIPTITKCYSYQQLCKYTANFTSPLIIHPHLQGCLTILSYNKILSELTLHTRFSNSSKRVNYPEFLKSLKSTLMRQQDIQNLLVLGVVTKMDVNGGKIVPLTQSNLHGLVYYQFYLTDILSHNEHDYRTSPLRTRRQMLPQFKMPFFDINMRQKVFSLIELQQECKLAQSLGHHGLVLRKTAENYQQSEWMSVDKSILQPRTESLCSVNLAIVGAYKKSMNLKTGISSYMLCCLNDNDKKLVSVYKLKATRYQPQNIEQADTFKYKIVADEKPDIIFKYPQIWEVGYNEVSVSLHSKLGRSSNKEEYGYLLKSVTMKKRNGVGMEDVGKMKELVESIERQWPHLKVEKETKNKNRFYTKGGQ